MSIEFQKKMTEVGFEVALSNDIIQYINKKFNSNVPIAATIRVPFIVRQSGILRDAKKLSLDWFNTMTKRDHVAFVASLHYRESAEQPVVMARMMISGYSYCVGIDQKSYCERTEYFSKLLEPTEYFTDCVIFEKPPMLLAQVYCIE